MSGIVILLSANNVQNIGTIVTSAAEISRVIPDGEDEPIIVRGHVRNELGSPIENATVKLKQGGAVIHQAYTNDLGYYSISDVMPGTYQLNISADGYVPATDVIVAGSTEIVRADTLVAE